MNAIVARDDPAYPWGARPEDHNVQGLFEIGPQEARPSVVRLIPDSPSPRITPPSPAACHQTSRAKKRAAKIAVARHGRLKAFNKLLSAINGR